MTVAPPQTALVVLIPSIEMPLFSSLGCHWKEPWARFSVAEDSGRATRWRGATLSAGKVEVLATASALRTISEDAGSQLRKFEDVAPEGWHVLNLVVERRRR